ncbi:MAG: hypothetical protein ABJB11_00005 [Ferruginibacter sp.]
MKKSGAKKLLFNELKPFFVENGYKLVTTKFSGFTKEYNNDLFWIYFDSKDYNPCQNIRYYVNKRINIIDKIWMEVDKLYFNIDRVNLETASTLTFTYESLHGIHERMGYLPDIYTVADVEINAKLIIEFMRDTAFPLLERFNDIREIDKEINGENFWGDDWRKLFRLSKFPFHRTIIAYLCSNKRIDEIREDHLKRWTKSLEEFPDCQNLIDAYLYLFEILKGIKPL